MSGCGAAPSSPTDSNGLDGGSSDGSTTIDADQIPPGCSTPPGKWRPTSTVDAPAARSGATIVWAAGRFVVYDGQRSGGGVYDPCADQWQPMATQGFSSIAYRPPIVGAGELLFFGDRSMGLSPEQPLLGTHLEPTITGRR